MVNTVKEGKVSEAVAKLKEKRESKDTEIAPIIISNKFTQALE